MKIDKVMIRKVLSCRPEDDLRVPAQAMWDGDCGCIPVLDSWGRVLGLVTDRDLCMAVYTQGRRLEEIRVRDVMSKEVYSCRAGDELKQAAQVMRKYKVRRLPVLDEQGKLVGLLSLNDIARAACDDTSRARDFGLQEVGTTLAQVCEPRLRPDASCSSERELQKLSTSALEIC